MNTTSQLSVISASSAQLPALSQSQATLSAISTTSSQLSVHPYNMDTLPVLDVVSPAGVSSVKERWSSRLLEGTLRCMDILVAGVALFFLFPLLFSIALGIRLTSRGPIFFKQARVGLFGETFEMLKFRTMVHDAEDQKRALLHQNEQKGGVIFKMKDDPRITSLGRLLRRWSLDELPQLLNIIRGEMSIVGPRPHPLKEVKRYPHYAMTRLRVKPGLTGYAQIHGRSDLSFRETVVWDIRYIKERSVSVYLRIIWTRYMTV